MKIYIGPYTGWFGPYQLAEKILFWMDRHDDRVHKLGNFLATGSFKDSYDLDNPFSLDKDEKKTLLYRFLQWIDSKKKRKVKINIDRYDVWNMDSTLALIILPMLKQLKQTKHGSPFVDDEDVPEHLRSTAAPELTQEQKDSGHTDEKFHQRWEWVIDELIWTFEQLQPDNDWEAKYYSGNQEILWKKTNESHPNPDTGEPEFLYEMVNGPNHTQVFDKEGYAKHDARIKKGLILFGKYYRGLWD